MFDLPTSNVSTGIQCRMSASYARLDNKLMSILARNLAEHFQRLRPPNVLLTTCYKPSGIMYKFLSEMLEVLPCATYYKRQVSSCHAFAVHTLPPSSGCLYSQRLPFWCRLFLSILILPPAVSASPSHDMLHQSDLGLKWKAYV